MMSDRLGFYSASKDVPPGQGASELVADPGAYAVLASTPGWRQVLSNFDDTGKFEWNGHTWRSIEHAFQATKISIVDVGEALRFTVESGDPLGAGRGLDARKARKAVILSPSALSVWDAESAAVMASIAAAKYEQVAAAAAVLRATGDAQLFHFAGRQLGWVRFAHLEAIREELNSARRSKK